jgi:hypothetical protein
MFRLDQVFFYISIDFSIRVRISIKNDICDPADDFRSFDVVCGRVATTVKSFHTDTR